MVARLVFLALCVGVLVCPLRAAAHPHVFVDPELTLEFDDQGLAGIRHCWSFDEMFTVMMLQDYDTDANLVFSPSELAVLKDGAFDTISEWGYFTYLRVEGQPVPVKSVQDFKARVEGGAMVYEFFVPLHVNAGTRVSVSVFDPDYYVDFLPPVQESMHLKGASDFDVQLDIAMEPGAIYSEWMITPTVVNIRFTRK